MDAARAWFILFYGAAGAISLGVIALYAYTWDICKNESERTTMLIKCVGFMIFSGFMIHANFAKSSISIPLDGWGAAIGIAIVNVGWVLRMLHILHQIKEYRP